MQRGFRMDLRIVLENSPSNHQAPRKSASRTRTPYIGSLDSYWWEGLFSPAMSEHGRDYAILTRAMVSCSVAQ